MRKRQKGLSTSDWERVYSYDEKRLKFLGDRQGYGKWEKENRSWELQNGLAPPIAAAAAEEEEEEEVSAELEAKRQRRKEILLALSSRPSLEDQKKQQEAFYKRLQQLHIKPLTEEEKKLKESYLENAQKARLSVIEFEDFYPFGPGWDLTPYCKCDSNSCKYHVSLQEKEYPPEITRIWHAYCRQCRQSHYFDIDDIYDGAIYPLEPPFKYSADNFEIMMELANRAIQEYNEKESNVFKYKVLKIEKVNMSVAMYDTFWMTVKVLNLTLGTPIETFQIHACFSSVNDDSEVLCCRPKEEPIIGLPSCECCFGLLPGRVAGGQEPIVI